MIRFLLILSACLFAKAELFPQKADPASFSAFIDTLDLKASITYLASAEMQGRKTGEEGQKKSAAYIAGQFQKLGLKEVLPNGYLQPFELVKTSPDIHAFVINGVNLKYGKDYLFEGEMDMEEASNLELIYLSDSLLGQYESLAIKGKAVAIHRRGDVFPMSMKLKQRGAALVVYLLDDKQMAELSERPQSMERPAYIHLPARSPRQTGDFHLRYSSLKSLPAHSEDEKPTFNLVYQIAREKRTLATENVIALLEGKRKDSVLVISAHYDHEGTKGGKVFYGADDNASGTAALLEMAQAFKQAKDQGFTPELSILFVAFSAEEDGLLGSYHYVQNPPTSMEKHMANLNMDMIGRVSPEYVDFENYVYILGANRSTALKKIGERVNAKYSGLELDYSLDEPEQIYRQSDQWPFAQKGIPALLYFNGVHDDYHQPTDTVDKINFPLLQKRARLVFFTAWEVAFSPGKMSN